MKIGKNARDIFASTAPTPIPVPVEAPNAPEVPNAPLEGADEGANFSGGEVDYPAARTSRGRGRPVVHHEAAIKITTVLLNRHVVYLDSVTNAIRGNSGAVVKRSEILRALVEALEAVSPDWDEVRSQNDLVEQLKARLAK